VGTLLKTAALMCSGWALSHSTIRECIESWVIPSLRLRRSISSRACLAFLRVLKLLGAAQLMPAKCGRNRGRACGRE